MHPVHVPPTTARLKPPVHLLTYPPVPTHTHHPQAPQCSCYPPMSPRITTEEAKQAMYGLCYTHYMRQCDTCGGDGSPESPCTYPLLAVSSACQGESDGVHHV